MMIALLIIFLIISMSTNVLALYIVTVLVNKLWDLSSKIEQTLDVLDASYKRLAVVSETPVMFDEPVVKEAVNAMIDAKNSVLVVANMLVDQEDEDE